MKFVKLLLVAIILFVCSFTITTVVFFDKEPYDIYLIDWYKQGGEYYVVGKQVNTDKEKTYKVSKKFYDNCYLDCLYQIKCSGLHRDKVFSCKLIYGSEVFKID